MTDTRALKTVQRATIRRTESDEAWRKAIKDAHERGCSLREIAAVAGVTNPRIHQIISE